MTSPKPPQLQMQRLGLQGLPPLTLPEGFILRRATEADASALAVLLQAAFGMDWSTERVFEALLKASDVRATFVICCGQALAATASAAIRPNRFPGHGYVHWVASHPDYRGKRLGYLASLAVLHEFVALGLEAAVLETDDFRLSAIHIYRELGFKPLISDPSHPERWRAIEAKLI